VCVFASGVTLDSLLSSPSLFSPRPAPSNFAGPPSFPPLSGGPWSSTTTPSEPSQPADIGGGLFPSGGGGGDGAGGGRVIRDTAGEALLKQVFQFQSHTDTTTGIRLCMSASRLSLCVAERSTSCVSAARNAGFVYPFRHADRRS
jgi:hypothetical protein